MCPSNAVEKGTNTRPGMLLEDGYACGTAPNGFARVNECAVEPAAAVEGDVHTGASTAVACKGCQICSRVWLFCLPCYGSFDLSSIYAVKYHLTTCIHLYQLSFFISTIPSLRYRFPAFSDLPVI